MRRTEKANLGADITNPVTDAMALGTEVVAGAIQAGGEIVAATADMAESAARAATAVSTGVVSRAVTRRGSRQQTQTPKHAHRPLADHTDLAEENAAKVLGSPTQF